MRSIYSGSQIYSFYHFFTLSSKCWKIALGLSSEERVIKSLILTFEYIYTLLKRPQCCAGWSFEEVPFTQRGQKVYVKGFGIANQLVDERSIFNQTITYVSCFLVFLAGLVHQSAFSMPRKRPTVLLCLPRWRGSNGRSASTFVQPLTVGGATHYMFVCYSMAVRTELQSTSAFVVIFRPIEPSYCVIICTNKNDSDIVMLNVNQEFFAIESKPETPSFREENFSGGLASPQGMVKTSKKSWGPYPAHWARSFIWRLT